MGVPDIINGEFQGHYAPFDTDQQGNSVKRQQLKGEAIVQNITPINVMPTPQVWELTASNDRTHHPMHVFQQTNTQNPNAYSGNRFSPSDYPPQRFFNDHQLINQQNGTVWNVDYTPSNNMSTPFQPQGHNPPITPQQNQLGPND